MYSEHDSSHKVRSHVAALIIIFTDKFLQYSDFPGTPSINFSTICR